MKFKFWTYVSALNIVLLELAMWFMVKSEFRGSPDHEAIMWLLLPLSPIMVFLAILPAPSKSFES